MWVFELANPYDALAVGGYRARRTRTAAANSARVIATRIDSIGRAKIRTASLRQDLVFHVDTRRCGFQKPSVGRQTADRGVAGRVDGDGFKVQNAADR